MEHTRIQLVLMLYRIVLIISVVYIFFVVFGLVHDNIYYQ